VTVPVALFYVYLFMLGRSLFIRVMDAGVAPYPVYALLQALVFALTSLLVYNVDPEGFGPAFMRVFGRPTRRVVIPATAGLLASLAFNALIGTFLVQEALPWAWSRHYFIYVAPWTPLEALLVALSSMITALAVEATYRGYLFAAVPSRSPIALAVASATASAFPYLLVGPGAAVEMTVLGLAASALRIATGGLQASFAMHAGYRLAADLAIPYT
jgi:hypothetical protein